MRQSNAEIAEIANTDISIAADGRVFVLGLSREVLHLLAQLCPQDNALAARLASGQGDLPRQEQTA